MWNYFHFLEFKRKRGTSLLTRDLRLQFEATILIQKYFGSIISVWGAEKVLKIKVLTRKDNPGYKLPFQSNLEECWRTNQDNVMVSETVAVQLPREADGQRTFPKPSAAVGVQEEHCGLPRRSGFTTVLRHVLRHPDIIRSILLSHPYFLWSIYWCLRPTGRSLQRVTDFIHPS